MTALGTKLINAAKEGVEIVQRKRFVDAALSYCGTPYHHEARIKGVGIDCATMLVMAGHEAGLVDEIKLPQYSPQWMLHRDQELYLQILGEYCREVEPPPRPGDIAIWKIGRTYSHAAVVVDWPVVVHAVMGRPVTTEDAERTMWLKFDENKPRPMKLFSFWSR